MMLNDHYFLERVLPQLPEGQLQSFNATYPNIRFSPQLGDVSVGELSVLMLVALTGTGKSTTLNALHDLNIVDYSDTIPNRRKIANLIVIPTAQVLLNEKIIPVTDRTHRFFYTKTFADYFPGGFSVAYRWLFTRSSPIPIISEGIRGNNEIAFALQNNLNWQIIELTIDPMIRLQRLSNRNDTFDNIADNPTRLDLSFLPLNYHQAVKNSLRTGNITHNAIRIMQAEAQNYGLTPYRDSHPRYNHLIIDDLSPPSIAQIIAYQFERMKYDA